MAVAAKRRAPARKAAKKRAPAKKAVEARPGQEGRQAGSGAKKAVKRAPAQEGRQEAGSGEARRPRSGLRPRSGRTASQGDQEAGPGQEGRQAGSGAQGDQEAGPGQEGCEEAPPSGAPARKRRRPRRRRRARPQGGDVGAKRCVAFGTGETGGLRAPGSRSGTSHRRGRAPRRRPASRRHRPGPARAGRGQAGRAASPPPGGPGTSPGRRQSGSRCPVGSRSTLVPSSRRSGTSVTPSKVASVPRPWARGRSPWATVTHRCRYRPADRRPPAPRR